MSFLSGCADRESPASAEEPRTRSRPTGQELFVENCAACHGIEGRGDGPLATELRVAPVNLRLLKQRNDGRYPTRRVQGAIDGRGMPLSHGLPEMPVWGREWKLQGLTETEVHARAISIANYIGTLQD